MFTCGLPGSTIFSHVISKLARFSRKKNYLPLNVCFDFLYNFCPKYFSFYDELSEILLKMYIGFHVEYPLFLSYLRKLDFPGQFSINPQIPNLMKIRPVGDPRGRTDMMKLTVAFRNFCERAWKRNQNNQCPGRDLNPQLPKYETFKRALIPTIHSTSVCGLAVMLTNSFPAGA